MKGAEIFLRVLNLVPLRLRMRVFAGLGILLYYLDARHRRIAQRNLALALDHESGMDRARISRAVFKNLGRVLGEFSFTPSLNARNISDYVFLSGLENFQRAYEKGRGVLFLTAHFGNWEWMAAAFPLLVGSKCHVVVRPLDNPFLDGIVERLRRSTGNETIPKQKSMARILRLLRQKEVVGILLDQNMAWQEGVFVEFFGELACTNTGMALLALKTGTPVLPAFNIRQPDGRYRIVIEPEVPLIETGDKDLDVEKNTELFTRIIERHVRAQPDHWLWLHQRWKTRPWQAKRRKEAPGRE